MIDPLRYRPLKVQLDFDEHEKPMECWQCLRMKESTPAFFLCHDCGKTNNPRPFCEPCFFDYHTKKRGKEHHKPHPIVHGDPVIVQTLAEGDGKTFAKMHDWVTLDYTLTSEDSPDKIIEDTFATKKPLLFQSGCSGPCVHFQLLGCSNIAAADILGYSDPYCAVYWKNELVGVTSTKHMTLDPSWVNQTFVLPLAEEFMSALDGDDQSALYSENENLTKLSVEIYDWDRLSKDDLLGQVCISDADILRALWQARTSEAGEDEVLSFPLLPKRSRGKLGIRLALRGKKLFVHIVKGEKLPNADPHSLSDPYCDVLWNETKVGSTVHIDDTLDPVWDLEIFVIAVDAEGPNSVEQSALRIVCLDWDQFGSNDALGQVELKGWQIKELVEKSVSGVEGKKPDAPNDGDGEVLSEVDVEAIFDFVQNFREQSEKDGGAGGEMVVGVPLKGLKQESMTTVVEGVQADGSSNTGEGAEKEAKIRSKGHKRGAKTGKAGGEGAVEDRTSKSKRKAKSKKQARTKDQATTGGSTSSSKRKGPGDDEKAGKDAADQSVLPSVADIVACEARGEPVLEGIGTTVHQKGVELTGGVSVYDEAKIRDGGQNDTAAFNPPGRENVSRFRQEVGEEVKNLGNCTTSSGTPDKTPSLVMEDYTPEHITAVTTAETCGERWGETVGSSVLPETFAAEDEVVRQGAATARGEVDGTGAGLPNNMGTGGEGPAEELSRVDVTAEFFPTVIDSSAKTSSITEGDNTVVHFSLPPAENGGALVDVKRVTGDDEAMQATGVVGENAAGGATVDEVSNAPTVDAGNISPQAVIDPRASLEHKLTPEDALQEIASKSAGEEIETKKTAPVSLGGTSGGEGLAAVEGVGKMAVEVSGRSSISPPVRLSVKGLKGSHKGTLGSPSAIRYREATVQRFEEDRGVLVQYTDDATSEWIATRLIPRLQIRNRKPIARNILQRIWDKRNAFLHLRKHVLNVKRGLKVLLNLAMTGSRMQWYPLELTPDQSGETFVRGTLNARFLLHTRGSVLRGLDVAVSHMSLGERAKVEVRSDYAFGEVYGDRLLRPYATMVFVTQVTGIRHRSAKTLLLRRAAKKSIEEGLLRVRARVLKVASLLTCFRPCKVRVGRLLSMTRNKSAGRERKHEINLDVTGDIEENLPAG